VYTESSGMGESTATAPCPKSSVLRRSSLKTRQRILPLSRPGRLTTAGHWVGDAPAVVSLRRARRRRRRYAVGSARGWIEAVYGAYTRYEVTLYGSPLPPWHGIGVDRRHVVRRAAGVRRLTLASCRARRCAAAETVPHLRGPT